MGSKVQGEAPSPLPPSLWAMVRTLAFTGCWRAEERCDLIPGVTDPSHCPEEGRWSVVRAKATGPAGRQWWWIVCGGGRGAHKEARTPE